ncbi:unnamed protein product, partial [marine sediment metagenome]
DKKRTLRNKIIRSRLRTEQNKFARMVERGDSEGAARQLNLLIKLLHQAAAKNIIHANKAARQQAQFQKRLNEVKAKAPA